MKMVTACLIGTAVLTGALVGERVARAELPTCDSLATTGNPASPVVYIQAGDTQTNLLMQLGRKLRDNTPNPITIVFFTSGSCTNETQMFNQTPQTSNFTYIPSIAENPTWTPASPVLQCTPKAGGQTLDIGNSAVFLSSCPAATQPQTVVATQGPVQAYVLAVPEASSQTAITYEEAYFVFGFGSAGMINPWNDVTEMYIRTVSKSTLLTWAANIDVPAAQWQGGCGSGGGPSMGCGASSQVVSLLQNAADPEKAIGILGDEVYDADRSFLNVLAFRAKGQYAAYYPDSKANTFDKKNVRDGHYTVWSPTIWMYYQDANNNPVNPLAKYVVDMIDGKPVTPAPNFQPDLTVASVGLVPDCAMRVQREFDGGPLSLYTPPASCTCEYEKQVNSFTTCQVCDDATPCAGSGEVCRNHLCEAN